MCLCSRKLFWRNPKLKSAMQAKSATLNFLTGAEIYEIFYINVFVTAEKNKVQVSKKTRFLKACFLSAVNFPSVSDFNDRNYKLLLDYSAKKAIVTNSIPPKTD